MKNVTRKDIAEKLGVSVSVVSRVINNSGYVSKEKREKVKEKITLNNKTNDDKMDRKEEIDSFLEEVEETEPEKEPGKIRSFFRWFGELF